MKIRLLANVYCSVLLTATIASAQTPPVAAPPGHNDTPISPEAVPGDIIDLPQRDQLKVPLGPPAGTHATRAPAADPTPTPGFELSLEAARAALASCAADGYSVGVAVTDAAGKLKVGLAADNTGANRVYMAIRKDVTATAFKMSTLALREKMAADSALMDRVKPNMSLLPGGMPIMKGDTVVGAIATSGATAYEEEKCAKAGIEKIQAKLQ
jgi:uncharacterized protein GlcG (DUF336 family)